jgi:hypothetical protein
VSKVVGIWIPIFAFVSLGFDTVVANMFFIPMALWVADTPGLTIGLYIWKGIIPALIGNILGGTMFVGCYYWWMYLALADDVPIEGALHEGAGLGTTGGAASKREGSQMGSSHNIMGQSREWATFKRLSSKVGLPLVNEG